MIKLIATDLDGTLLDDHKKIHPSFWDVHKRLTAEGIIFAAASGRQYYTLQEQFEKIEDDIIILAENGTFVKYRDNEILVNALPLESARFFIEKGRRVKNTDLILCGKNCAYVESKNALFWKDAAHYYKRLQLVDDLLQIDETILKVTLWDHHNSETNAYPHFREYENQFKIAVAGDVWLDITNITANKGSAIRHIQDIFGISPEETLIFGDYLNDIDMMSSGWHSYAMKNAHPKIIELARFTTQYDNNNNGVVQTLKELFAEVMS